MSKMQVEILSDSLFFGVHLRTCPLWLENHPRQIADPQWFRSIKTLAHDFAVSVQRVDGQRFVLVCKQGMPTDGMSSPAFLAADLGQSFDNDNIVGAVPHDGGYGAHFTELERDELDIMLRKLLELQGKSFEDRWKIYEGVHCAGWKAYERTAEEIAWYRQYVTLTPM